MEHIANAEDNQDVARDERIESLGKQVARLLRAPTLQEAYEIAEHDRILGLGPVTLPIRPFDNLDS